MNPTRLSFPWDSVEEQEDRSGRSIGRRPRCRSVTQRFVLMSLKRWADRTWREGTTSESALSHRKGSLP